MSLLDHHQTETLHNTCCHLYSSQGNMRQAKQSAAIVILRGSRHFIYSEFDMAALLYYVECKQYCGDGWEKFYIHFNSGCFWSIPIMYCTCKHHEDWGIHGGSLCGILRPTWHPKLRLNILPRIGDDGGSTLWPCCPAGEEEDFTQVRAHHGLRNLNKLFSGFGENWMC